MLGVVDEFSQEWLREPLRYLVAVSAVAILVAACNAAMLGVSRLGYSLALNRQIPSRIGYLHPRTSTPVVIIGIARVAGDAAAADRRPRVPARHLRVRRDGRVHDRVPVGLPAALEGARPRPPVPDPVQRPRRAAPTCRCRRRSGRCSPAARSCPCSPSTAARAGSASAGWRSACSLYVFYRLSEDKPLLKRISVPEKVLTRKRAEAEYGSILVPVLGTPLDDDIVQTAGRLAAEEDDELGEGGAVIEALWVFEVPMALPLDARIPDAELKRARKALGRAKAVGEEYEGVEVATAVVRARRAGEAIVHEAKRRGVEAIVLAAEEPTRMRGGVLSAASRGCATRSWGRRPATWSTRPLPRAADRAAGEGPGPDARVRRAGRGAEPATLRCPYADR